MLSNTAAPRAVSVPRGIIGDAARAAKSCCSFTVGAGSAALFAPLALLTHPWVQKLLMAVLMLNMPMSISKHFFYSPDAEDYGSIAGLDISLGTIALAALWAGRFVSGGGRQRSRSRDPIGRCVVLVFVVYGISILVAQDATLAVFEVWALVEASLLYLYVARYATSREDIIFLLRMLMIGLILEDLVMLAQAAGLVSANALGLKAAFEGGRLTGTFGSPNSAGCYLAIMMVLALGLLAQGRSLVDKGLAITAFALSTTPLVLSESRTAWIAFVVGLITAAFAGRRTVKWKKVIVVVVVLIALILPSSDAVVERLTGDDNGSAAARMPLNQLAMLMIEDHPVLGVGANNFPVAMEPYVTRGFLGDFLYTVHNHYLLVWSETGTVGLLAFVLLLCAIVMRGWRCCNSPAPFIAGISLGVLAAVVALMTDMLFDLCREGPTIRSLWLFGGVITALSRMPLLSAAGTAELQSGGGR